MGLGSDAWNAAHRGSNEALARALSGKKPALAANHRGLFGKTPLTLAAASGSVERMRMLLNAGARVDEQDDEGNTALAWASRCGQTEAVKWLLAHGCRDDLCPQGQEPRLYPLVAALMARSEGCIQAFEEAGVGPSRAGAITEAFFAAWDERKNASAQGKEAAGFAAAMARWEERRELDAQAAQTGHRRSPKAL